jgi:hypothetical protein
MFSAQQLQNFAGKKRVTQETFDEAVKENIEEFEMEVRAKTADLCIVLILFLIKRPKLQKKAQ